MDTMNTRQPSSAPMASPQAAAKPKLFEATPFMVALLTALTALGQFATNIYLPSLPAIARDLASPVSTIQYTLTVFLATFALVQLAYGPLEFDTLIWPTLIV